VIRKLGGSGRLETQFSVSLTNFESDFVSCAMAQMSIFHHKCVVIDATMVADAMEMFLTSLVALGKAATVLLANYLFDRTLRTYEEYLEIWQYVISCIDTFFSGRRASFQKGACLPRESIVVGHRPLFNPAWKKAYILMKEIPGIINVMLYYEYYLVYEFKKDPHYHYHHYLPLPLN
jgi:hypothetical protein